ncbi:hypothetical protein FGRMN_2814 [Fusarium graminum]|nr:hypothetical protein FGRMN_2814 [Fusarium graminum]
MATQTVIIVEGIDKPYRIVDNIRRSTPGPNQVLVKCLAVGLSPVEAMQQHTGLLISEWPAIIGSDCAGVVVETGANVTKLSSGDHVCGVALLGQNKFAPFQETFLAQEDIFIKLSPGISVQDGCTIGSGLLTAALCLLSGADLKLPEEDTETYSKDEWIVILGGSGSVGQYAVQISKLCGYKVLASSAPSKQAVATRNGASATFNSRRSVDEQVADIQRITNGNFGRIMDASSHGFEVMVKALQNSSTATDKYLTTVDDWSDVSTPAPIKGYRASLGHLYRLDEPIGARVTADIVKYIPTLEKQLAAGTLKPLQ